MLFPFIITRDQGKSWGFSKALFAYRMRWKRRRLLLRSLRRWAEISPILGGAIPNQGVLVFSTVRNEMVRIEHWLSHYRALGVAHFLIVDNASDDGTGEFLRKQPDVSLWITPHSYKASRFGVDWLTCLQIKHGVGRWCLTVDADELLVYPDSDTRDLSALTEYLDSKGVEAFGALMLDMYPKGPIGQTDRKSVV